MIRLRPKICFDVWAGNIYSAFIRSNVRQHVVALILAHNCGKYCNSTSSRWVFFCAFLTHHQPAQWRRNGQIYHKRRLESIEITFGVFIIVALDHQATFKIYLRLTGYKFNIVVKNKSVSSPITAMVLSSLLSLISSHHKFLLLYFLTFKLKLLQSFSPS